VHRNGVGQDKLDDFIWSGFTDEAVREGQKVNARMVDLVELNDRLQQAAEA
jgi:hypothetical protein